jgi:hypothetical protein
MGDIYITSKIFYESGNEDLSVEEIRFKYLKSCSRFTFQSQGLLSNQPLIAYSENTQLASRNLRIYSTKPFSYIHEVNNTLIRCMHCLSTTEISHLSIEELRYYIEKKSATLFFNNSQNLKARTGTATIPHMELELV